MSAMTMKRRVNPDSSFARDIVLITTAVMACFNLYKSVSSFSYLKVFNFRIFGF